MKNFYLERRLRSKLKHHKSQPTSEDTSVDEAVSCDIIFNSSNDTVRNDRNLTVPLPKKVSFSISSDDDNSHERVKVKTIPNHTPSAKKVYDQMLSNHKVPYEDKIHIIKSCYVQEEQEILLDMIQNYPREFKIFGVMRYNDGRIIHSSDAEEWIIDGWRGVY